MSDLSLRSAQLREHSRLLIELSKEITDRGQEQLAQSKKLINGRYENLYKQV